MPGRLSLNITSADLLEHFGVSANEALKPRYNVAPSTMVPVIRAAPDGRRLALLRWGLIPEWADDPKVGYSMINARCETVAAKPAFRRAFRTRRCLVPASGYYEWKKEGKNSLPFHICRRDGKPLAFAGIWERWAGPDGAVESFAILTADACPPVLSLHDRMPVILRPEDFAVWLDPAVSDAGRLQPLLTPYAGDDLLLNAVSSYVNKVGHEGPECLAPATG